MNKLNNTTLYKNVLSFWIKYIESTVRMSLLIRLQNTTKSFICVNLVLVEVSTHIISR